jgi:hypothetical protein
MVAAMRTIIKNEGIAVGERSGVVLLHQRRTAKLPQNLTRTALEHEHSGNITKTDQQMASGYFCHGVAVCPFLPVVL